MNKDIIIYNDKGQRHGLWERYHLNDNLWYKCVYINGKRNGFAEYYLDNEWKLINKNYYL